MTDPTPPKVQEPQKECPFCNSLRLTRVVDDGLAWTRCKNCGATGPETSKYSGEEGEPYFNWNSRVAAAAAPAPASHGEREAFEAWWNSGEGIIPLMGSPLEFAEKSWFAALAYQAALQSRATIIGTQDARAAAEEIFEALRPGTFPRAYWCTRIAAIITKHHTPSGPAALIEAAKHLIDAMDDMHARGETFTARVSIAAADVRHLLTPEGSAAKEKTE